MLYPQSNSHRQVSELSGFWDFRFDPQDTALADGWSNGFIREGSFSILHNYPESKAFSAGREVRTLVEIEQTDLFHDGRFFIGDRIH